MKKNSTFVTVVIIFIALGMIITFSSFFNGGNNNPESDANQQNQAGSIPNNLPNTPSPFPPNLSEPSLEDQTPLQSDTFSYQGEDGKTALQILKERYDVQTTPSDLGEMVQSIQGNSADSTRFWAFKVNDEMASEGAGTYLTKSTDQITWELTPLQ